MGHTLHGFFDRLSKSFKHAVPRLPGGGAKARLPRWIWILPISVVLGIWANQGSRAEGRMEWLKKNPPAYETWQLLIQRRGFLLLDDPAWREQAFGEMPDTGRAQGAALISEDRLTVAIRTDGDWQYNGLGRSKNAGQPVARELWVQMGIGWEAVAHFERLELPAFPAIGTKARTNWVDSRSLSY